MYKHRILKLIACLPLAAALVAGSSGAASATKPNIVFFFIDDMGWKDWRGNDNPNVLTPNIDKIARDSVQFDQGYVNAANCAPSRCALLAGQYTPRTQFYNVWSIHRGHKKSDRLSLEEIHDGQALTEDKFTFAEALQKAGYTTAMYGKWHISGHGRDGSGNDGGVGPKMQGFDDVLEHSAGSLGEAFKQAPEDPKKIFSYTARASEFIEECNADKKPFMIYMAHHAVHAAFHARRSTKKMISEELADGKVNHSYASCLFDTDASIGIILDKLDELRIRDNTVIIFLSDNGGIPEGGGSQAPLRSFKGCYYEGGIRVPFMISLPKQFKPRRSKTPVMAIDLYPTMLSLAGVQDIEKHIGDYTIDGTSLLPELRGGTLEERALFWYYPAYLKGSRRYKQSRVPEYRQQPVSVIRKGDWKLLLHHEEWSLDKGKNALELYNLAEDMGETKNLANEHPERCQALLKELLEWHKDTNAVIPSKPNSKRESSPKD